MWSLGCVLAEIMIEIYKPNNLPRNTTQLFKGMSCYPLSPTRDTAKNSSEKKNNIDNKDQLCLILQTLDDLQKTDTSFITDDNALMYLSKIQKQKIQEKASLETIF